MFYRILLLKDIKIEQFTFSFIWNGIWETKFVSIYWFFIPLFCIYLSIPLFAAVSKDKKMAVFKYILHTSFICNICIPFLKTVSGGLIQVPIYIAVGSGYLFYVLGGYFFTNIQLNKSTRIMIYISGFVGLFLHIFGTYTLSMEAGKIVQTYKGYNNLPCVLYSLSVFLFIKQHAGSIPDKMKQCVNMIKEYTFSIYLLHWFVMVSAERLLHINRFSLIYRLGSPYLIGVGAIAIALIIQRTKIGRVLLPK